MDPSDSSFEIETMTMVGISPDELRELIPAMRPDIHFEATGDGGLRGMESISSFPGSMQREFRFVSPGNGATMVLLTTSVDGSSEVELEQVWQMAADSSEQWLAAIEHAAVESRLGQMVEEEGGVPLSAHVDYFGTYAMPRHEVLSRLQEEFGAGATWDQATNCLSADQFNERGSGSMHRRIYLMPTSDLGTAIESHVEVNDVVPVSIAEPGLEDEIASKLLSGMTAFLESIGPLTEAPQQAGRSCPQAALALGKPVTAPAAEPVASLPDAPRYVRPVEPRRRVAARSSQPGDWLGIG